MNIIKLENYMVDLQTLITEYKGCLETNTNPNRSDVQRKELEKEFERICGDIEESTRRFRDYLIGNV